MSQEHTVEEIVEEFEQNFQAYWELPKTNGSEVQTMIEADRREKVALYQQERLIKWLRKTLTSLHHSHKEEIEQARSAGVNDGYKLAVKHLKEAYEHNKNTTTSEAIEWLADNARLITPNTHST